jgi:hypothetical protein
MKLLINFPLNWETPIISNEDDHAAWAVTVTEITEGLSEFGVSATATLGPSRLSVQIPVQKVVLAEEDMNTLFFDVLGPYFDVQIRYSALGGRGCDFTMATVPSPTA